MDRDRRDAHASVFIWPPSLWSFTYVRADSWPSSTGTGTIRWVSIPICETLFFDE